MSLYDKHMQLVDDVNNAKTEAAHRLAEQFLRGWREGVRDMNGYVSLIDADLHSMARFEGERPMCGGVLLDWKPEATAEQS